MDTKQSTKLDITIPASAIKYLLFQRGEHQFLWRNRLLKKALRRIPFITYERVVAFESFFAGNRVRRLSNSELQFEYEDHFRRHLPQNVSSILDIGCGVAKIDALLWKHYRNPDLQFWLLDRSEIADRVYYGFQGEGAFYTSLNVARDLLEANGVPHTNIHLEEVAPDYHIHFPATMDLVISIFSWGYHYPISMYLDRVYDMLAPGGTVITDIRKDTGGEDEFRKKFPDFEVIFESRKMLRVCAKK